MQLVKALVRKGDPLGAAGVIRDLDRSLRGSPELVACKAIATAMLHEAAGNKAGVVGELKGAADAVRGGGALSSGMRLDLARACLAQRLDDEASNVLMTSMNGGSDGDGISARQALDVFVQAGRPELADGMNKQLRAQAQILLGVADEKRNMGDVRGAVQTLLDALRMAPNNLQVMIAVAGGVLRQVMEMGWDEDLAATCAEQLEHIRALDPAHPRLQALDAELSAAKRKYGIST